MPKEWDSKMPNVNKFERAVPANHQELLANLSNKML